MNFIKLAILMCFSFTAFASGENTQAGGRSAAMGNASVAISDIWSLQNNQAGLGWYNQLAASAYYDNKYLLKELSFKAIAVSLPVNVGTIGLNFNHFGSENYNEMKFGLAFARAFGNTISAGLQLDYFQTTLGENYGKKSSVTFEAGLQAKLNDKLKIGFHAFNPIRARLSDYQDERIPTIFRLGAAYHFSESFMLVAEVEKGLEYEPLFKIGAEYQLTKNFFARFGVSSNPDIYSFGVGFMVNNFLIDLSSTMHPVLGYSPQASITYVLKK